MSLIGRVLLTLTVCVFLITSPLAAQPFSAWLTGGPSHGYIGVPHSSNLNFTNGFTMEAWVSIRDDNSCSSIAGKGFTTAWWVGVCGTQLRSYLRGSGSSYTIGNIPVSQWTHIAVTWDGTTHRHFIDGEEVGARPESGAMTTNAQQLRIFGDPDWSFTPTGGIDEVRFWNVARTRDQIRSTITSRIDSAEPGLVAVYHMDGNGNDPIGGNHGTQAGTGTGFLSPALGLTCTANATTHCFGGGRFQVSGTWLTSDGTTGAARVVTGAGASTTDSGLFWFFGATNWEVLVKILNGCPVNNHKWVFSAATTDVHYQLVATDHQTGQTRRYFNYLGNSAPAITDTSAFQTCP